MQKIRTLQTNGNEMFDGGKLTIGLDLGNRLSSSCVWEEAKNILPEQKVPTATEAVKKVFGRMVHGRIAMETRRHSPW